jgi:phenylalanyl-tRNA synthetase beta chain
MNVPYSWLIELLPELPDKLGPDPHALEPIMAMLGTGIEEIVDAPAPPDGVIFGVTLEENTVLARKIAPDGLLALPDTHLKALKIDVGDGLPKTVVTGAPNARAGIGVAVAVPGTQLAAFQSVDTDGQGTVVGERQIQGVLSWGMACSPKELGIGEYGGGLLELPATDAKPGTALSSLWPADHVLDIEVTPNRADSLSVLGIARDIAAYLKLEVKLPSRGLESKHDANFPVQIELDPKRDADRFIARMAKGVKVGPSPAWLQRRVVNGGMRAINNLVDASNYVMLELGQPTAAYDVRDVPELTLTVRDAKPGEKVLGLTDLEYECDERDLLVATPVNGESVPVGIGGILGAKYSSITDATTDVIIEAAHWNPVRLRLTGRRLGLATDALYRFERGVDPNLGVWAADRYMELVQQTGGGEVVPGHRDVGGEKPRVEVQFRPWHANEFLGTNYDAGDMKAALERLGFEVVVPLPSASNEVVTIPVGMSVFRDGTLPELYSFRNVEAERHVNHWLVLSPTWRVNMDLEEDLIEEVARILGYDAIPETIPSFTVNPLTRAADAPMRAMRALKDVFVGVGFQEVVSYTFTHPLEAERTRVPTPVLEIKNPQSSERTHLRTQLVSSLLYAAQVNKGLPNLMLFEVGQVFPMPGSDTDHPGEDHLGLLMSGPLAPKSWGSGVDGDFFAFKGLLEAAAAKLGDALEVRALEDVPAFLHPGLAGEIVWNGQSVGVIGAVHPQVASDLELPQTFVAELKLPLPAREWTFIDPSRQPPALRDLAIIAPKSVPYSRLETLARGAAGLLLEGVEPFDVYEGKPIPEGSRSVAIHLSFRAPGRTLTDAEVDAAMQSVIASVRAEGLEIRE